LEFNILPMLISMVIALTGLGVGYWVYRKVPAGAPDPLQKVLGGLHTVLKNKYYFDELYNLIFIRPAIWVAEVFTSKWMDRGVIDGILHTFARMAFSIGGILRNYFDKPVVNGFGDLMGEGSKKLGRESRVVQTGRVQQYMLVAVLFACGVLAYYLFVVRP
jgi:NADH-quinone oxidoreductase subunit L